jgi:hypothetical protein
LFGRELPQSEWQSRPRFHQHGAVLHPARYILYGARRSLQLRWGLLLRYGIVLPQRRDVPDAQLPIVPARLRLPTKGRLRVRLLWRPQGKHRSLLRPINAVHGRGGSLFPRESKSPRWDMPKALHSVNQARRQGALPSAVMPAGAQESRVHGPSPLQRDAVREAGARRVGEPRETGVRI